MHTLSAIILLAALIHPTVVSAEIQTFSTTHTYTLGDDDSRNSARQKCLAEAKRQILEQVGVYLETASELITSSQSTTYGSVNSPQTTNKERQQITEQINTLAAGVMRTEVIKEEFGEVNGRLQMTLTLRAEVDPNDIQKQLTARRIDQRIRKQVTEQEQRLAQLEDQLSSLVKEMRSIAGNAPPGPLKRDDGTSGIAAVRERANKGDAAAQNLLAMMYASGQGIPQNYAQAAQWYEKAASQGDAWAQTLLGMRYYVGRGVPQDYIKAWQWYETAANRGNAEAQNSLGMLYENGQGVPQDYLKARQWYEKAAAQGNTWAQTSLGVLCASGRGLPQDYAQAAQWYEKAAAQGNAWAQTLLGMQYDNGQGVPQDYIKAHQWYEKAAAQGNEAAQYKLGVLYANGRGVPQDNVKAYIWWDLSAAGFIDDAQKAAATGNRDKIARRMTPAQIAEAQRFSQQCQAQEFKGC